MIEGWGRIGRDDMGDSYGAAYTTRSSDEGYGESYGEAAKAVMEKKAQKEDGLSVMQRGATAERDTSADAGEPRVFYSWQICGNYLQLNVL